jgi:hypothetical protein
MISAFVHLQEYSEELSIFLTLRAMANLDDATHYMFNRVHCTCPSHPILPLACAIFANNYRLVAILLNYGPLVELDMFVVYDANKSGWESAEDWVNRSTAANGIRLLVMRAREVRREHFKMAQELLKATFPENITDLASRTF